MVSRPGQHLGYGTSVREFQFRGFAMDTRKLGGWLQPFNKEFLQRMEVCVVSTCRKFTYSGIGAVLWKCNCSRCWNWSRRHCGDDRSRSWFCRRKCAVTNALIPITQKLDHIEMNLNKTLAFAAPVSAFYLSCRRICSNTSLVGTQQAQG